MNEISYYQEYAQSAIEHFAEDAESRYLLVNSVQDLEFKRVLDIGCGAGQELLPFIEKKQAFCVGIDIGEELGKVGNSFAQKNNCEEKLNYSRSKGEELPFADESFDVVLCRVALPYMHNKKTISEVARVLKPEGVFLLKTHAPMFYVGMIKDGLKNLSPKQIIYPLICLANGAKHLLTGKQTQKGIWEGKEVFQTRSFLEKEFKKHNMKIEKNLPDTNIQTPSFCIIKN